MKMYLLSDNNDTLTGLRLCGIDGVVIHTKQQALDELERAKENEEIGILLITAIIGDLIEKEMTEFINENTQPVVVVIPDRHGNTAENGSDIMASAFGIGKD